MKSCDFCKIIRKKLDKDIPLMGKKIATYKFYKKNFRIRQAVGICRGFNLCSKHTKTIKKDNKLRINKGIDIPNNLILIKKLTRSDI